MRREKGGGRVGGMKREEERQCGKDRVRGREFER